MRTEGEDQAQQGRLSEGMRLIFDQDSPATPRSSRSRSRDSSCWSGDGSSASSGSPRGRPCYRSSDSSSSSSSSSSRSRSRSGSRPRPRCHRASYRSRCRHRRRSRSYSPSPKRSSRRRYSRSSSRSSSRERYCRRSGRSRSRSPGYRRGRCFVGRFRYRRSPSPRRTYGYYRSRSRSPGRSAVRLSHKDKMDLLNIAKENAAKLLGVEKVELPESIRSLVQPECDEGKSRSARLSKTSKDEEAARVRDGTFIRTSPTRKPITFSPSNTLAKPQSGPVPHGTEGTGASRADSLANRKPYGLWIPVQSVSPKKR